MVFVGWLIWGNHTSTLRVDRNKLSIEEVKQGIFNDYIRLAGNVEPKTFVQLTSLETGRVVEKVIEEGIMVKKGAGDFTVGESRIGIVGVG